MKTPSKFPSSAYFGAALLVMLFLLTCFQAQGQVSSAPKDTLLVFKNEKAEYVRYPFYLDASLEGFYFFYLGVNANAGIYLNSKHAIGISYFIGASANLIVHGATHARCIGLQYCGSVFKDPELQKMLYYKIEAGKLLQFNHKFKTEDGFITVQPNKSLSKPYMARATFGVRFSVINIYFAVGTTGKLVWDSTSFKAQSTSLRFTHITLGLGLTLPLRKS
jgi:hypothetical protein